MERTNVGYCLPAVQSIFIHILPCTLLNKILHKLSHKYLISKHEFNANYFNPLWHKVHFPVSD